MEASSAVIQSAYAAERRRIKERPTEQRAIQMPKYKSKCKRKEAEEEEEEAAERTRAIWAEMLSNENTGIDFY